MKFVIEIVDFNDYMSSINVYGRPDHSKVMSLYEQMPYMKRSEVFDTAITLACRLRSAGFDVEVNR